MSEQSTELVRGNMVTVGVIVPGTGEIMRIEDPEGVADALTALDELIEQMKEAKRVVTEKAIDFSMEQGTRTLTLDDGRKVVLSSGETTVYDADEMIAALAEAGMPEDRINEIVVPTTTYKVNGSKAKSASSANPAYRAAIESHTRKEPRTVYASVKS
jgi:hypothetical protein